MRKQYKTPRYHPPRPRVLFPIKKRRPGTNSIFTGPETNEKYSGNRKNDSWRMRGKTCKKRAMRTHSIDIGYYCIGLGNKFVRFFILIFCWEPNSV
ncbi:hypothetical protein Y032_0157g3218 [Ancylostoma ceylanicum]|uniref:Uncharacterized protein n=1 Tax=Ancylostoma ceylanicum TaxID=53326 RepID=A0A016SYZ3_9BILA|nr:hypothetical protein Y032_0157g3218 [Ancylostoma ceylanicum]